MLKKEVQLKEKLQHFNEKLNSPSIYYTRLIKNRNVTMGRKKEVIKEARELLQQRKLSETKEGMIKLRT
jgi:hypothetical protein